MSQEQKCEGCPILESFAIRIAEYEHLREQTLSWAAHIMQSDADLRDALNILPQEDITSLSTDLSDSLYVISLHSETLIDYAESGIDINQAFSEYILAGCNSRPIENERHSQLGKKVLKCASIYAFSTVRDFNPKTQD